MLRKIYQVSIEGVIFTLICVAYLQCFYPAVSWAI